MTGVLRPLPSVPTVSGEEANGSPSGGTGSAGGGACDRSERMPARPRLLARAKRSALLAVVVLVVTSVVACSLATLAVLRWTGEGAARTAAMVLSYVGVLAVVLGTAGVFVRRSARFIEGIFNQEDRLVRAVAHEVREPLGRLLMTLEDGRDGVVDPQEAIREAQVEAERVADFVGDLTEVAKVMSGAKSMDADPVRLDRLAGAVAATSEVGEATVSVEAVAAETTGSHRLLRLALTNLVRNAARHAYATGPGVIEVIVDHEGLAVCDRGPGVEPDLLRRISTARPTALPRADLGLGLMSAEWAAELHGGRLSLGNRPGGGFEARLELPVREPDDGDDTGSEHDINDIDTEDTDINDGSPS